MDKKRNKYFFREKEIIRLKMKDAEIHDAIRNQGLVELEEPIHKGYYAEWVLRDDILRREDAAVFQEALDACKSRIFSKTPDFLFKDYKTKKMIRRNPGLMQINKAKYESLSPSARKLFYEDISKSRRYWRYGFSDKFYICTLSYELAVKVTKAYITHRTEHDNVLYQMDAENEKMLYQAAGNGNPWGGHGDNKWWRRLELKREKNAAKRQLIKIERTYKGNASKNDLLDI
jgi:hypothetical protein